MSQPQEVVSQPQRLAQPQHVVATAGHVDHGKSSLVRALTGMEPDRWAEERRRGLSIDLGFAWTDLPGAGRVAFVDVPGHERFVANMLAGVGPVPAVLLVVAADEGWMPQSSEHLDALAALGVRHGLLVLSRADLADPVGLAAVRDDALARLAATPMGAVEAVTVSTHTGAGLTELRTALARMLATLETPDPAAPTRLWVDRAFAITGAGTVVTGTLGAGQLAVGDELVLSSSGRTVRVRALRSTGEQRQEVTGVCRVGVNLRGLDTTEVHRGDALLTPGGWTEAAELDVRLTSTGLGEGHPGRTGVRLQGDLVLHIGSAAVAARVRLLGSDTARVRLARPVPVHVGDRALLRDPGRHRVVAGLVLLDVAPEPLRRRGAAARRAHVLASMTGEPDSAAELARRGLARRSTLAAMGLTPPPAPAAGDWLVDPGRLRELATRLEAVVTDWCRRQPLESGMPLPAARAALALPTVELVELVRAESGLQVRDGRVCPRSGTGLPEQVARAVAAVLADLAARPFAAPEAARLAELGLGQGELAAAVRAGLLVRIGPGIVLDPDAPERAVRVLSGLPQPFTVSQARQVLGTSRRVALPLLDALDRAGRTIRDRDDRRRVAEAGPPRVGS